MSRSQYNKGVNIIKNKNYSICQMPHKKYSGMCTHGSHTSFKNDYVISRNKRPFLDRLCQFRNISVFKLRQAHRRAHTHI